MEVLFIGFVKIHTKHNISPANEPELRSIIVEATNLEHISNPVPIEACAKTRFIS